MASLFKRFFPWVLTHTSRAMTHDETVYPEPFAFKPERFFDKNGDLNDDDRILAYGFGHRWSPSSTTMNSFHDDIEFVLESMLQVQRLVYITFSVCRSNNVWAVMVNVYIHPGNFQYRKGERYHRERDTNKWWIQGIWVHKVSWPFYLCIRSLDAWYFSSHKTPFECSITPRSREHRQLIEEVIISNKWVL